MASLSSRTSAGRGAMVQSLGYSRAADASVNVVATAGGTALTASLSTRAYVEVFVPVAVTATIYLSVQTPTSTVHFQALTGGQSWGGVVGAGITLTGLSSSGTVAVKVLELGVPL